MDINSNTNPFISFNGPNNHPDDPITFDICHSWNKKYPDDKYGGLALGMCISDYVLSLNGIILFFIIVYQLYNYRRIYKVPSSDRRV